MKKTPKEEINELVDARDNFIDTVIKEFKLIYNKIRIFFLRIFTDRIKRIDIKDKEGKTHRVTTETKEEKIIEPDTKLKRISNILYQSMIDKEQYFIIPHKVQLNRNELITWMEQIGESIKIDFAEFMEEEKKEEEKINKIKNDIESGKTK